MNRYWRPAFSEHGELAIVTRGAKVYRDKAAIWIAQQHVVRRRLAGALAVRMVACPPDRKKRDLDNLVKPVLDVLWRAQVIADDMYIDDLHVVRGERVTGGELRMKVATMEGGGDV